MMKPRILRDQHGSVLIESAFVLSVTITTVLGIFNLAIVLFGYCNATYSARAAARYASLHSSASLLPATTASIQAVVTPYLVGIKSGASTVTTTYSGSNVVGQTVKVTVALRYTVNIPLPKLHSLSVASIAQRTITR